MKKLCESHSGANGARAARCGSLRDAVLVVLSFVAICLSAQDMAVATVRYKRTEPVSGRQLQEMIDTLETQQGRELTLEERKQLLENLIDQVLINQVAEMDRSIKISDADVEQAGLRLISQQLISIGALPPGAVLTDKTQYRQIIKRQGVTIKEFEDIIRKQLLAETYITRQGSTEFQSIKPATDEEISSEYQKRIQEFVVSDSVWFNHIFFDTTSASTDVAAQKRAKAEEVLKRLKNTSATFIDLVMSESEDDASKTRGGLVGPIMKGDEVAEQLYGKEYITAVFKLKVDEISNVLRSKIGYHIIQITEKKAAQLLPKDSPEVRTYLEQLLFARKYQQKFDEVAGKIIDDLRSQSTINYFGEYK